MHATGLQAWGMASLLLAWCALTGRAQQQPAAKVTTHMVAMGDGVKLATDVYLPGDGAGRYPVIVARTPYNKNQGGAAMAANATRDHQSFESESFLEAGKIYEINVDLWSTSLVFNRGHRIRAAVSSSNSPRFEANPNTGKPFRADKETRVANNTIYLSLRQPSHIILPVIADNQ